MENNQPSSGYAGDSGVRVTHKVCLVSFQVQSKVKQFLQSIFSVKVDSPPIQMRFTKSFCVGKVNGGGKVGRKGIGSGYGGFRELIILTNLQAG